MRCQLDWKLGKDEFIEHNNSLAVRSPNKDTDEAETMGWVAMLLFMVLEGQEGHLFRFHSKKHAPRRG